MPPPCSWPVPCSLGATGTGRTVPWTGCARLPVEWCVLERRACPAREGAVLEAVPPPAGAPLRGGPTPPLRGVAGAPRGGLSPRGGSVYTDLKAKAAHHDDRTKHMPRILWPLPEYGAHSLALQPYWGLVMPPRSPSDCCD